LLFIVFACLQSCNKEGTVRFIQYENKIDVLINGKFATSYLYSDSLTKPALYPVVTPAGVSVTRNFPFKTIPGESHDHPHHTGVFFTYDEVNDTGFWANTSSPPQIKHIAVTEMTDGKGKGTLSTVMHWVDITGRTLLEERRTMVFYPGVNDYAIDFDITLTAQDTSVVFEDTKEGMFAIRVAQFLEEKNGIGKYRSSRGAEGSANIWGQRAEWVGLEGEINNNKAGIVIIHHPSSTNFPTFWHVRDYGLFSANPLGQYVFQKNTDKTNPQPFKLTLKPGENALFRFLVIIYDGTRTTEDINQQCKAYYKS